MHLCREGCDGRIDLDVGFWRSDLLPPHLAYIASGRSKLDDITFDASISEQRQMLTQMEDMIYLKQRPFTELIAQDQWTRAIEHYDEILNPTESSTQGLDLLRQTGAKMQLFAGLNRWEEAEENAVSLLALQTGRDAQVARLILALQVSVNEICPRLHLDLHSEQERHRSSTIAMVCCRP